MKLRECARVGFAGALNPARLVSATKPWSRLAATVESWRSIAAVVAVAALSSLETDSWRTTRSAARVATEIGVVMIVYLDEAWQNLRRLEPRPTCDSLMAAIRDGAAQRVRPVMMTFFAIVAGLLPIMWSHGTGSLAMKRIAAPMVGGMVSTTILTLLIVPLVYFLWRSRSVEVPPIKHAAGSSRRTTARFALVLGTLALGAGGWWLGRSLGGPPRPNAVVLTRPIGPYQVRLWSGAAQLVVGENPIRIEVADASGRPADVASVWFELKMDMPGMPMQATAQLEKAGRPGVFTGVIRPTGGGEWHGQIGYRTREGRNQASIVLSVKP